MVLRSELAKLMSLRSTAWCLGLGLVLTVALSAWVVSSSKFYGDLPEPADRLSLVHQPMPGNGSIVAHIAAQDASHPWAKAGVIVKRDVTSGSPYAAIMLTPAYGLRLEAAFTTSVAGPARPWLKLTRSGSTITGYASSDGSAWDEVGSVELAGLPSTVEVGLFVTSPFKSTYMQGGGRQGALIERTVGRAVFDHVRVESAASAGTWAYAKVEPVPQPGEPQLRPGPGGMTETGGAFTVIGEGDIAWYGIPSYATPDVRDMVSDSLQGVQIGLLVMVVLGVLAATGEYKTGMIRTTLAVNPRRGQILAAKATVVAAMAFLTGLAAGVGAFLITQPILRGRGVRPPAYAFRSLAEAQVLRAVIGTAAVLALVAVLAFAAGMLLRRSSRAIPVMVLVVLVPQLLGPQLSLDADKWVRRLTPTAGLAIQQTIERFDTAIAPWPGLGVLAAYTAAALGLALWALRRRNA